jgi:hypothetical protein
MSKPTGKQGIFVALQKMGWRVSSERLSFQAKSLFTSVKGLPNGVEKVANEAKSAANRARLSAFLSIPAAN